MSEIKSFEEILNEDGVLVYTCKGMSMYPLLRQNKDLLVIHKPDRELKKYDIVLFKSADRYVLHRIIKIEGDMITTAGDHNTFKDRSIHKDQILGILTSIVRDGKEMELQDPKLRVYGHLAVDLFVPKVFVLHTKAFGGRIIRKLKK